MSLVRKVLLFSLMFACVSIVLVAGLLYYESKTRESLLATLKDYILTENTADLSTSELRVHQYALLAQFDPFFALPGADIEKLELAISGLLKSRESFLPYYDDSEQEILLESLYPRSFLALLTETEHARRDLLQDPDKDRARAYHQKLEAAIRAYLSDIGHLNAALDLETPQHVGFWNGTTNSAFIQKALHDVQEQVRALLAKEQRRYACTSFFSTGCDLFQQNIEEKLFKTTKIPSPISSIPSEVERNRKILNGFLSDNYDQSFSRLEKTIVSPVASVIISDTAKCGTSYGRGHFALWWSAPDFLEVETGSVAILDELYFDDLAKMNDGFSQAIYEKGVPYMLQKLNPYLCVELGYDYGELFSAYYVWRELQESPIFSSLPRSGGRVSVFVQDLTTLEARIRSQPFVYTEEIKAFLQLAETELFTNGRVHLRNLLGTEKFSSLERYLSVWNTKSAWQENVISRLVFMTPATIGVLERVETPLGVLFLTRSYLSFLYLLGNPSFVPRPPGLMQVRKEIEAGNFHIVTYDNTLRTLYSLEELPKYLIYSAQIVDDITLGKWGDRNQGILDVKEYSTPSP